MDSGVRTALCWLVGEDSSPWVAGQFEFQRQNSCNHAAILG